MKPRALYHLTRSVIDGAPIAVVCNGFPSGKSGNSKTGQMIQVWILRLDVSPLEAVKTGDDRSICGDCPHRWFLDGGCYVTVHRAPLAIWKALQKALADPVGASYQPLDLSDASHLELLRSAPIRFGAYGDPGAVESSFWSSFFRSVDPQRGWTGYSHQWRVRPDLKRFLMASVDSQDERAEAALEGWRTFRILAEGERLDRAEFTCPASEEAGKTTVCALCKACDGAKRGGRLDERGSVAIGGHGARKGKLS